MKKLFGIIFCSVAFASASMIGLDALGEEQSVGAMTSAAGRGFAGGAKTGDAEGVSVVNPARIAFDTRVVFNVNFLIEMLSAERGGNAYAENSVSIPSFNLSFPMGSYGALGLSLWQSYASVFNEEIEDSATVANAKLEYKSSVYEIVPEYSLRLPYLRNFAIGASAHFVMGNTVRDFTLGPDNSGISKNDAWATNQSEITDRVDGSWDIKNHPAYYSLSLMYRGRQSSFFFSYATPHTLQNDLTYNLRFSQIDTLAPSSSTREIDVPATFATGMNFRFMKRNNVMFDLQWRSWDKNIENIAGSFKMDKYTETQNDILASIGFQRDGSGLYYDPYLDRISYRLGGWFKSWYVKDVYEFGGSLGAGFPLGRKGTTIDVALQGGKRFADNGRDWEETFIGIRLGLMGIGRWGQTR